MRFNTAQGKRTLADRSKYDPHQNAKEKMRRVGQIMRGNHGGLFITDAVKAAYVDYATTKAAGGDLTRFSNKKTEPAKPSVLDQISDDLGGLAVEVSDVTVDSEAGPGPS